ncbi:MAG TPA: MarC family protein [Stellaceae bacterium]|nr:MarC family protein [Stellaceae bacterium]
MLGRLLENFVTLFVVLDPVGSVPIFLNATARIEPRARKRVAILAVFVASLVLLLFLYLGQYLLEEMHIGIPAFRIAGAVILFVFALRMIFSGHHDGAGPETARSASEIAVFPVAMPGIASPGALCAVVLLTDNNRFSFADETVTAGLTLIVMVIVLAALLMAGRVNRVLGNAGISVITQVMGLILASFSVQQMIDGALDVFAHAGPGH